MGFDCINYLFIGQTVVILKHIMNRLSTQDIVDHNRLQRSLSQKSKLPHYKEKNKPNNIKNNSESIIHFQVPQVTQLLQQFEKQIKNSITFHSDVATTKSLPKCYQHNNVQTMYCLTDKKPLCVSCLYMSTLHKPHKVVPLQKANLEIEQNIRQSVAVVRKKLQECQQIIKINEQYLKKAEKQFPELLQTVHNFYLHFHEMLVSKKNEQLHQISQFWTKVRNTYNIRNVNLKNVKNYIKHHLDHNIAKNNTDSLHVRNVVVELAKIQQILENQLSRQMTSFFKADIQKFKQLKSSIEEELVFRSNEQNEKKDINFISNITKSQKKAFAQKTKSTKQFRKDTTLKTQIKQSQPTKDNDQQNVKSTLIKNRHSKSDLLSKSQILSRRKSQEKTQYRKKMQQYHKQIMMKQSKQKSKVFLSPKKAPDKSPAKSMLKK